MTTRPPRITELRVERYRALRDLTLKDLTPLTVLLGPNGSGKSTVFDVFAFLAECFQLGLRKAWDRRGRFRELRTRDADGPIAITLKFREGAEQTLMTYHLAIDEGPRGPFVANEWLQWRRGRSSGRPFKFLDFTNGSGTVISGDQPDEGAERIQEALQSAEILAVNTLGQFAKHPRVAALRTFITGWHLSCLSTAAARETPDAGPAERLSQTGDNLANVVQHLQEQHPDRLRVILETLSRRVPRLERVDVQTLADGRLLLQVKDAPFAAPILSKYASDGTLKLLAYLLVLHDPAPPPLIGIEEPENFLHPRLLTGLAEACRAATAATQLMVTTHSPSFVDGLRAEEVHTLYRDARGYTQACRAVDIEGVSAFMAAGATLGDLWLEGRFGVGDPSCDGRREPAHRRPRGGAAGAGERAVNRGRPVDP